MLRQVLIKCARVCVCVILGLALGLAIPIAIERWTPSYKYYADMG